MNEVRRQAYLQAMGIDSWFPRYVLPGAAPSHPCAWPLAEAKSAADPVMEEAPAADVAPAAARSASRAAHAPPRPGLATDPDPAPAQKHLPPDPAPARKRLPPLELEGTVQRRRPATRAGAPAAAGARDAAASDQPARFRLAFLRCGPLAVLSHQPHLGPERLGNPQRRLFLNLLRALGLPADVAHIPEGSFRWPFAEALLQDAGVDAARLALGAYLEEHIGDQPVQVLLVLGEALAPFVLPPGLASSAKPGRLLTDDDLRWKVLVSRSLDEVLSVPALKRELWRHLAALPPLTGHV